LNLGFNLSKPDGLLHRLDLFQRSARNGFRH
jgi:hypothetical protein